VNGGKVDGFPPKIYDITIIEDTVAFNSTNGVCVVNEIPRERIALEYHMSRDITHVISLVVNSVDLARERDAFGRSNCVDDYYKDVGDKWIEVIRKSRGKHSRKKLQC
jgi:hypothetical protein